jgi:hypothetical protein
LIRRWFNHRRFRFGLTLRFWLGFGFWLLRH